MSIADWFQKIDPTTNNEQPTTKLVAQEILVRDSNYQVFVALDHALAGKTGIQPRIYGAVDKVLFFLRNLRKIVNAGFYIKMAGAATANPAAIMLQLYIVIEGHIQHRFALHAGQRLVRFAVGKFKCNIYCFHYTG